MASNEYNNERIFLSYQSDSEDDVKRLKEFLEKNGYEVWMNIHEINSGEELVKRINNAIIKSNLFIACITKKYVLSEMCSNEIHLAKKNKKLIIPLLYEELNDDDLGVIELLTVKEVDFQIFKTPEDWTGLVSEHLITTIQKLLSQIDNEKKEIEKEDVPLKKGTFTWPDGTKYDGDWIDEKKTGKGTFIWEVEPFKGDKYEGDFFEGEMGGKGTYTWANGNIYEGDWKDSKMCGQGIKLWKNGDKYEGDWINDKRTGKGTLTWANGDKYEGDYVDGIKHGKGIKSWANGDIYEGDWNDDKICGKGIKTFANGDKYEGDFLDGKKHGKGIYFYANGDKYDGEWIDDKRKDSNCVLI